MRRVFAADTKIFGEPGMGMSTERAEWVERERGLPVEIAAKCGVTEIDGKLGFEYRRSGRLQYVKLLHQGPDGERSFFRDRKGAETCGYLEHTIEEDADLSRPLVLTEGEFDAIAIAAAAIPNVVSVPDGAQLSELGKGQIVPVDDKTFSWLWDGDKLKSCYAQFDSVILATDNDRKGHILREELAVRFGRWKCQYVTFPDDCKDANDVWKRHGAAALVACIEGAKPLVPDRLVAFGDIQSFGSGECYTSGFKGLDEGLNFAFVMPELCVVTGEPGSGKSEFTALVGANLANYHQLPGAILQFEDRSVRVRETLIRYALNNANCTTREDARAWVDKWFRTIEPDQSLDLDQDFTLDWVASTIREARVRHGCRWVILDPWNELDHLWDRSLNEATYTNEALRKMKRLSRAHQIILFIVAHPSKEGARQKEIQDMDLYGISGSAAWANKADHGLILHRPDKGREDCYLKVAKSKDQMIMGRPGICRMKYLVTSGTYKYVGMGV